MKLSSSEFAPNAFIPRRFTCQGDDVSPPLRIEAVPPQTRSLALIMDDPDAPGGTFDHWVLYNLPADTTEIAEGTSSGTAGVNGFGRNGYGGPCPPEGAHRYVFRLYALDETLDLPPGLEKEELEKAIAGHVVASDELIGQYAKRS